MIYVAAFILSLFFLKLAMVTSIKYKTLSRILEIIGILIPCMLAALRDYSIGTDIEVYIHPLFNVAKNSNSFFTYFKAITSIKDLLYLLVTYICAHVSNNIGFLFFTLEMLVIGPVYIALKKKFKNSNCLLLGMLLFYLLFYNQSYNMVRQSIAIAFIILGLAFYDELNYKKFTICFIAACLFHNTAFSFFIAFLLYKFISSKKVSKKTRTLIEGIVIIVCILSIVFLPQLINLAGKIGIISMIKSQAYINKYLRSTIDISYIHSVLYLFVCFVIFHYKNRIREHERHANYYIFTSVLSFIILQLGSVMAYAERIGYYLFYPIVILILPYIIWKEKENITKNDFYILVITLLVFIVYWIIWICVFQYNATYPYVFR